MNIIVKAFGSEHFHCRPDTTWERENNDFFSPDFVNSLYWSPVVFVRICKAGKSIGRKFVSRYYDGANFGILMYDGGALAAGGSESLACASVLDHTSILPFPMYNPALLGVPDNEMQINADGKTVFSMKCGDTDLAGEIGDALCTASERISVRTGDILALELAAPSEFISGKGNGIEMSGMFCDNELFRFRILM